MPGGVNSPVRAFEPYPFFTSYAKGSRLYDVDGGAYVDFCMGYGALLLGHANPAVIKALRPQLKKGTIYGTPTEAEVELAGLIKGSVPCVEMLRLVNSGTEATMHAIRAARGYTSKELIVKFEGCYHGAHDYVLARGGSQASTSGASASLGVPKAAIRSTLVLPFNDIPALEEAVDRRGDEIAAVIIEPVMGNAGVIPPREDYLKKVRRLTERQGIVLIFDEVITGFRLALGGAQEYYGVTPDMVSLGKILGGGLPLSAFGGRREIMALLAPLGKVYQAGTFSGNPLSVNAGLATLRLLIERKGAVYTQLERKGDLVRRGLSDIAKDRGADVQVNCIASMFQVFFTPEPVYNYAAAERSDRSKFARYHRRLMGEGVFIPPSQLEACFLSTAHTYEDLNRMLEAADSAFKALEQC